MRKVGGIAWETNLYKNVWIAGKSPILHIIILGMILLSIWWWWWAVVGGKRTPEQISGYHPLVVEEGMQDYEEEEEDAPDVEMVIARYNESLAWLKEKPFSDVAYIVYNKSDNEDFVKLKKFRMSIPLENVGRETHSYLKHIIDRYDKLADVTVFLPGSAQLPNKFDRSKKVVSSVRSSPATTFSCFNGEHKVNDYYYNFTLDTYQTSDEKNKNLNSDESMQLSDVRPFGKWYTTHFGENASSNCAPWNAIFAVTREDIRRNSKEYYEKLLSQVDSHKNPETGHYFERAWETVFSPNPLPTTKYT